MSFRQGDTIRIEIDPMQNIYHALEGFIDYVDDWRENDGDNSLDSIVIYYNRDYRGLCTTAWIEQDVFTASRIILLEKGV